MNALQKQAGNSVAAAGDNYNPFAMAGAGAGSTTFMKFTGATGSFTYGQDDEEMPHGTQMAGDIENAKWIWSFWWEGEVLETRETMIIEDPMGWQKEPDDLPEAYDGDMSLEEIRAEQADRSSNFMDGWSCQTSFGMREIGGEGEEFTLKLNQGVALNSFRSLLSSFGRQFRFKQGLTPIIEIDARSYKSKVKGVGKRFSPVLKIVDWKSEEELMAAQGEDPGMYDEPGDEGPATLPAPDADKGEDDAPAAPRGRAARGRRGQNYG